MNKIFMIFLCGFIFSCASIQKPNDDICLIGIELEEGNIRMNEIYMVFIATTSNGRMALVLRSVLEDNNGNFLEYGSEIFFGLGSKQKIPIFVSTMISSEELSKLTCIPVGGILFNDIQYLSEDSTIYYGTIAISPDKDTREFFHAYMDYFR